MSRLDDVVQPELPATATYGIDGGAAEPVEAIKPITDVIAAAPRAPPEAIATGTAIVGTSWAVTIWLDTLDCKPAHKPNNKSNNIGDRLLVIGAIESDRYFVKPIELLVIAAPKDKVAATMIMLGQDTPFTIDSLILINGFFSYFKIDRMIIPSRGGIAVPKPSIHSKNLISIRLGNTHRAMTRTNVAKTIFSPLVAGGISFFILSNSFDCKSIPFVLGFIRKRKTNIIAAKISNPTGIANIIYCP